MTLATMTTAAGRDGLTFVVLSVVDGAAPATAAGSTVVTLAGWQRTAGGNG